MLEYYTVYANASIILYCHRCLGGAAVINLFSWISLLTYCMSENKVSTIENHHTNAMSCNANNHNKCNAITTINIAMRF